MKKFLSVLLVAMMSMSVMAGDHEIGAIVGGLNGVSYKYWLSSELAVQADLAVGLTEAAGVYTEFGESHPYGFAIYDVTLNPNMVYNIELPANFYVYAGAGFNIGFMDNLQSYHDENSIMGKFGANAIVGAEYKFNGFPLTASLDIRPGYGLGFRPYFNEYASVMTTKHFFDWKVGLALRYCL